VKIDDPLCLNVLEIICCLFIHLDKQFILVTSGRYSDKRTDILQAMKNKREQFGCDIAFSLILLQG